MICQLLLIAGVVLLYLFFYYAAGSVAAHFIGASDFSFSQTLIAGFFSYFFIFTIIALPMKVLLRPLSNLSAVWAAVLAVIVILFLLTLKKRCKAGRKYIRSAFEGRQKYITLALLALILLQVFRINLNDETYALWDQSYYLGDAATSLYTNTISQYDPYTGRILDYLNSEYLLETYQNHDAVMCRLLGLHPMVENLTVMASVVVILYHLLFFEIGKYFFRGDRTRSLVFVFFISLLNFFSYNLFTAAEFLYIRPSESKTILAVLIVPTILYFFLKTTREPACPLWWRCSFLVILSSFGLNMSSIYMVPFEITALYLPFAFHKRSWRTAGRYAILLLPCIVMAALYLITKNSFLIYTGE